MITGIVRSSVRRYAVHHSFQLTKSFLINHRVFSSHLDVIEKAKERLNQLAEDPGNEAKLKLYGLYKQVCKLRNRERSLLLVNYMCTYWYNSLLSKEHRCSTSVSNC